MKSGYHFNKLILLLTLLILEKTKKYINTRYNFACTQSNNGSFYFWIIFEHSNVLGNFGQDTTQLVHYNMSIYILRQQYNVAFEIHKRNATNQIYCVWNLVQNVIWGHTVTNEMLYYRCRCMTRRKIIMYYSRRNYWKS